MYPTTPRVTVIAIQPRATYLLLSMSNGQTKRVPVVRKAGVLRGT